MNKKTIEAIHRHVIADYPREACGLVCAINGRETYVPCKNEAANPDEQFVMNPADFAGAEDRGEILALVHSHPNASARASEGDRVSCENSGLPWHIFSVSVPVDADAPAVCDMQTIEPKGYEAPLVGRQFVHGVLDCYTLIRDYFDREHGIKLKDYARRDEWWVTGENLYMDHYAETGFTPISDQEELQIGDIIIMQIRSKVPNHGAIYIGDGIILHHLYGRLSTRDVYGGYWREVTCCVVRHKELSHG